METETYLDKLVFGARQGLLGTISGRFLSVLGSILAARLLGPTIFGLYAIGWTLLKFLSLIFPLGMDRAILHFAPKYYKKNQSSLKGLFILTLIITFVISSLFGLLILALTPWLTSSVYHNQSLAPVFQLYAYAFPAMALLIVSAASTRVTHLVKYSVLIQDIGQPLLGLILLISLYLMGYGLIGIILSDVLSLAIAASIGLFLITRLYPGFLTIKSNFQTSIRELLKYSIPASLGGAFSVYILWVDRILIGYFRPAFDNGIYLAVSQISTFFLVISAGINTIVVPIFSTLFHESDWENLQEVFRISTKWAIYLGIPLLAVVFISPSDTLAFIFGDEYRVGVMTMLVLVAGQWINLCTGSVNPLLMMTGNQKIVFNLSGLMFLVSILLNIILIPQFGLLGAALSTSTSISFLYILEVFWVKRNLQISPYDKRYIKGLTGGIISVFFVLIIKALIPSPWQVSLVIQGLGAVISFITMLFLLKFDKEDELFFSFIKVRINKNIGDT